MKRFSRAKGGKDGSKGGLMTRNDERASEN